MLTSTDNPRIRQLIQLTEKSRKRREEGLTVVEGVRELGIALQSGYKVQCLYFCPDIMAPQAAAALRHQDGTPLPLETIPYSLYEKVAYRGSTEGVLAVVHAHPLTLAQVTPSANPLVIVLESVEKPGNLGAILRTADAVSADAVLVCDPLTDIFNPNTLRASLGCLFSVPTVPCTSPDAYEWLTAHHIQTVAANCQATYAYHQCNFTGPTAVVMGTEDKGLGPFWREKATLNTKIPMRGKIDSLNVSVATAVLCFEIVRQRTLIP